jgi:uncharacterized protein
VHSLTLGVVYVPTEELQSLITRLPSTDSPSEDETLSLLVSQDLIVENAEEDERLIVKIRDRLKAAISLELLYLLVTDGCNLRCTYCFEETPSLAGKFRSTRMDSETVTKSLDLFAEMATHRGNPAKKKVIHLYGGEPLANRTAVYQAIKYADTLKRRGALPMTCQTTIVTNGVLLTEEDARLFAKYGVTVGLSIDGPSSITDRYRIPKREGIKVTERVTSAFRMLKKHGVSVGLSVTLTPDAIEHGDDFLEFFTNGTFREADGVSLNLLHFTPNVDLSDEYYRNAVELQIKAFRRFRETGLYEERIMRKARAFVDQEPMYADCGVVGYQLVVAPDGRIGVCQDFIKPRKYFPRSVYDADHGDLMESLFADWRDHSPFFLPLCKDCQALGICGGGCPASAELQTGNRNNLDERACHQSKQVLEWLVWDAYEQLGNERQ